MRIRTFLCILAMIIGSTGLLLTATSAPANAATGCFTVRVPGIARDDSSQASTQMTPTAVNLPCLGQTATPTSTATATPTGTVSATSTPTPIRKRVLSSPIA